MSRYLEDATGSKSNPILLPSRKSKLHEALPVGAPWGLELRMMHHMHDTKGSTQNLRAGRAFNGAMHTPYWSQLNGAMLSLASSPAAQRNKPFVCKPRNALAGSTVQL